MDSLTVYMDAMASATEIYRVNNSFISQQPRKKEIFIRWQPPTWPWNKLNTNGSGKNGWEAGAGGVIRDSVGHWISKFCMKLGRVECLWLSFGLYIRV